MRAGDVAGVFLKGPKTSAAVLSSAATTPTTITGPIEYAVPGAARHVVCDVAPQAQFTVAVTAGPTQVVKITPGGGPLKSSAAGVLSFQVSAAGAVAP